MAYTKQTWENLPSQTTPINADRLTHIEDGIFNAAATADTAASDASSAISGLADKVDKVEGKGLSTNDFTDTLKTKLDGIASGAQVNVQADYAQTDTTADDYIKNKPTLGTASAKNSTSVVTQSTDLVESGAVKDIVGWGDKNKLQVRKELTSTSLFTVNRNNYDEVTSIVGNGSVTADQTLWLIGDGWNYSNCEDASKYFKAGHTYTLSDGTNNNENQFIQLNIRSAEGVIISARSDNLNQYYRTFTMPSDLTGLKIHCWLRVNNGQSMTNKAFYPQLEEGTSITSFEPYHASVDESKCDNSVIGTVEDGANPTKSYAVGEHMIRGGKFCTVTSPVTTSSTWVEGSNYTSGDVASVCADRQTGSVGSPNEKITLDANDNKVIRVGSVVNFRVRFTVTEAITNTSFTTLFVMPSFAKPLLSDSIFQINSRSAPYGLTGVGVYIEGSRNVGTKANIPASVYEVHGCYLAE